MNYRIKVFFYAETTMVMPMEELYSLDDTWDGRIYVEKFVDEMKWQILHAVSSEVTLPSKFRDKLCVVVEPVKDDFSPEFVEHVEDILKKGFFKRHKVFIRTKNGLEVVELR